MAVLHNAFMRGFNSIYNQALEVQPQDYKPFLCYAQCIYECIDVHHSGEETTFFPGIEEATGIKGIMDVNIAQHGKDPLSPKSTLCTHLSSTY
jgi:hypothetical protein